MSARVSRYKQCHGRTLLFYKKNIEGPRSVCVLRDPPSTTLSLPPSSMGIGVTSGLNEINPPNFGADKIPRVYSNCRVKGTRTKKIKVSYWIVSIRFIQNLITKFDEKSWTVQLCWNMRGCPVWLLLLGKFINRIATNTQTP